MLKGFISRIAFVVLIVGLLAIAVVQSRLQPSTVNGTAVSDDVGHLLQVSDQVQQLIATAFASAEVSGNLSTTVQAAERMKSTGLALHDLAVDSPITARLTHLVDAVKDWAAAFDAVRTGSDRPSATRQLEQATTEMTTLAFEVLAVSRNLIAERLKSQEARTSGALQDLTALFLLALVASAIAGSLFIQKLVQRMKTLPQRFERMVFEQDAALSTSHLPAGRDPIANVACEFGRIAERLRAQLRENEKIERMAFSDALTGLPNRRGLLAFLDALAESRDEENQSNIGLVHIDLDHFKTINDTMGHDAGDTVLRETTKRMSTAIRDTDLLARLGGDEFVIVATGIECEDDLTRIADRISEQFESPILYKQRVCHVGVSMGLVLGGQRGRVRDPKRLLINADMALFRAKAQGRGQYAIFNSAMADEARRRNERSIALAKALRDEAFRPWFQPMFDLSRGELIGLELLARWHDDTRGVLMPNEFLDDAEANSLMEEIGLQVLEHAISALRSWRMSGLTVPKVHLNLSRTQLLSSSFVDRFSWTLDEANLHPDQFAVEIDERDCNTRGSEVAYANIKRLRDMGFQIVLDNFGVDRASLSNVAVMRARMLKCSPKLFERILDPHPETDRVRVLTALDDAAKAFGVTIGAKDVENQAQSDLLRAAGINAQQGALHAGVLNAEDAGSFLAAHRDANAEPIPKAS